MKLDHSLTPYTKINSNWIEDLNVIQESIIILVENTGSNLCDLGYNNFFLLHMSLKARETKAKNELFNYWDFIKIKSFCKSEGTVNKTKRQHAEWEKIFANVLSDKGLVSKIYKELSNSTPKEQII